MLFFVSAAEIRLIYSDKQLRHLAAAVSNRKLTIQSLSETLSTLLSVAQCDIFAYEAIDGDLVALVMPVTSQPTHLQRQTCFVEASRITEFINQRHPLITSQALTSFLLAAEMRAPALITNTNSESSSQSGASTGARWKQPSCVFKFVCVSLTIGMYLLMTLRF